MSLVTRDRERILGRYAHRASVLAMRAGSPRHLRAGLLANCLIDRQIPDWRDELVFFAPYVHVAHELGVDPTALFDEAATHAVPALASIMQTFGRRTDITLRAFGWREVATPDGPTFEMLDMRGSPTGAVVGDRSWTEVNEALARKLLAWVAGQSHGIDQNANG
ncbi:MAG: hypothetical protein NVSMB22_04890 [Chloroflexota bacterium]